MLQPWTKPKGQNNCVCVAVLDEIKPVRISSRLCVSVLGEAEKVIQVVDVVQMTHTDDPTVTYPPPPATPTPAQPRPQSQPNTYNNVQKTVRPSDRLAHLPDEQRLLNYVMRGYEKSVRPVRIATTPVVIRMGLTLTQIFDMVSQIYCITGFAGVSSDLLYFWFAGGSIVIYCITGLLVVLVIYCIAGLLVVLVIYCIAGLLVVLVIYWFAGGSTDLLYYWFAGGSSDLLCCWFAGGSSDLLYYWFAGGADGLMYY